MTPIEKYCEEKSFQLAEMIDEKMGIVIKPRPYWMPPFLYRLILKESVEIISLKENHHDRKV